jgi:hypothetical protein
LPQVTSDIPEVKRLGAGRKPLLSNAKNAAYTYGRPIQISPPDALLQEVHRTAGHVQWLAEVIADLSPEDIIANIEKTVEVEKGGMGPKDGEGGFSYTEDRREVSHGIEVNTWIKLYQRERQMLVRVCAEAIKANIEERYIQLQEKEATALASAISNIVRKLGHSMADEETRNIVRVELQQLNAST